MHSPDLLFCYKSGDGTQRLFQEAPCLGRPKSRGTTTELVPL
jgi:hypothetical protein